MDDPMPEPHACDAALVEAFAILGKRWNGLIISVLAGGPTKFSDLRRSLESITDSMLTDRLGELARAGLVDRVERTNPQRVEYSLTARGAELGPIFNQLGAWVRRTGGAPIPA